MQTEAEFQQQVIDLAHILGWHHLHIRRTIGRGKKWTTATNLPGWPDLLLWHERQHRVIAAELKSDTGQPTPAQHAVLASLAAAGIETHIWRPADWHTIQQTLTGARPCPPPSYPTPPPSPTPTPSPTTPPSSSSASQPPS